MKHQLANQSINVRISGLQEMNDREVEMQKQILHLTETVTKLTKQANSLSLRYTPTTTTTTTSAVLAVTQQHPKHPVPTKPPQVSTQTYVQVAEKQPREFTDVKSKKA